AFGVLERNRLANRRLRVLLAVGLDALALHLLVEIAEVVVGPDLEADAHAPRLVALAQHHRVMVDRAGEISGILVATDQREAENLGVVLELLVDVGHLIRGVRDLADPDHGNLQKLFVDQDFFGRGSESMTSTVAAISCSLNPMSMKRR